MDEGKRPLHSEDSEGCSMDHLPQGGAEKDKHRGGGSSVEALSSITLRGGKPPVNAGCDEQPIEAPSRRAGKSVVREEDVQERNSQEGYNPNGDSSRRQMAEILSGEGGSLASEGGEDEERKSGEDEKRGGHGGSGGAGRSRRKSGWLDKEAGEGSSNRNRRRKFSKKGLPPLPNPPPDMPREFKDKINGLGGKEVTLIMQKVIRASDMKRHRCRLSLPKNQFTGMGFLREGERRKLDETTEMPVRVIFPNLSEKNLIFTVWGKRKKAESNAKKAEPTHNEDDEGNGGKRATKAKTANDNDEDSKTETTKAKSTDEQGKDGAKEPEPWAMYVFRTGWRAAAEESGLDVLDRIQLWSFRVDSDARQDQLHFALIRLPREDGGRDATGCSNFEDDVGCSTSEEGRNTAQKED